MAPRDATEERRSASELLALFLQARVGTEAHRRKLMSTCIWKWTEAFGKYDGCRYWSEGARSAARRKDLRHEHVVPRRLLIDALIGLDDPTPARVASLLETHAVACVVTIEEHARLPELSWARLRSNPWARYSEAGVDVVDTWSNQAELRPGTD